MTQLNLNIVPRLPYAPENFLVHAGVREAYQGILGLMQSDSYSLSWIEGRRRYGKTHFSVKLADTALSFKKYPRLLEPMEFSEFLNKQLYSTDDLQSIYLLDDAQIYFESLSPGNSGPFVSFVEFLRLSGRKVIFFSSSSCKNFKADEHVMTRLFSGHFFNILNPEQENVLDLLLVMSKQRGMDIKRKRLAIIAKKVRRDIEYMEAYLDRVSHLLTVLNKSATGPLLSNAL